MKKLIKILGVEILFLILSFLMTVAFVWFVTQADSLHGALASTINSFTLGSSFDIAGITSIPEPMFFFLLGVNIIAIGIYLSKEN